MERPQSPADDGDQNPDERALEGEEAPTGIVFPERRGRLHGFDYSDGDYRSLGYGQPPESLYRKTRHDQTVSTREELLSLARKRSALDRDARPLPGRRRYRGLRLGRGAGRMSEERRAPVREAPVVPGSPVLDGLLAGALGTVAMTASMFLLQAPLMDAPADIPPQEVMEGVAKRRGAGRFGRQIAKRLLAGPAHFAFGAVHGLALSEWMRRGPERPIMKGALYGAALWASSYIGVLPTLGITRPVRHKARGSVAVNVLSHLVWGVVTAQVAESLLEDREEAVRAAASLEKGRPAA